MTGLIKDIIFAIFTSLFFIFLIYSFNKRLTDVMVLNNSDFRMSVSDSTTTKVGSEIQSSTSTASLTKSDETEGKSYFSPKSQRNPFLSPLDYEKIKLMEEEKIRQEELIKKIGSSDPLIKKENPAKKYKLQGIVGKYAIINGDMVREGQIYKKEIKLEKVYSNYVIIKYKGRAYKLIIK